MHVYRILALAVGLGVLCSLAASGFLWLAGAGQDLLFVSLPTFLGFSGPPAWLVAAVLIVGALLVILARRMPGATGPGPLTGFHFDIPVGAAGSVLVAAAATLMFGFVLGPEAPLIVLGSVIGAIVMRGRASDQVKAGRLLGGAAAIGAVFGNPFITAFMLLEFSAMGLLPAALIPAVLVALASGYAVQVGVLGFGGIGTHSLAVPGLPTYDTIGPGDLAAGLLVAVVAAAIAVAVRTLAQSVDGLADRARAVALLGAAVVTAVAFGIGEAAGGSPDQVLFSGDTGMASLVAETSLQLVLVILVTKAIAYAAALGAGLRGGPIFPATYLGVAVAIAASLVLTGVPATPLVAAGIAATAAGITRLPATSAILGAILVGGSGAAVAPLAIMGAIAGLMVRELVERRVSGRSKALLTASPGS